MKNYFRFGPQRRIDDDWADEFEEACTRVLVHTQCECGHMVLSLVSFKLNSSEWARLGSIMGVGQAAAGFDSTSVAETKEENFSLRF